MTVVARAAVFAAIVGVASCGPPTAADHAGVAVGSWGGDHLRIDVTPTGATIEYDCAHGTIDEPPSLDRSGRFSAAGTHTVSVQDAQIGGTVTWWIDDWTLVATAVKP